RTDVVIAAHATRENHYAILVRFENFLGFHSQEISITLLFSNMFLDKDALNPSAKVIYFLQNCKKKVKKNIYVKYFSCYSKSLIYSW
ncbi:hypothetical protein VPJ68_15535, partial [Parabacteroides distasonis]